MGRIIQVEYAMPVICEVDVEEGTIVRVVADHENIAYADHVYAKDGEHADAHEVTTAYKVAEGQDWPAWERGF